MTDDERAYDAYLTSRADWERDAMHYESGPVCVVCGEPLNLEAGDFQPHEDGGDICDACNDAEQAR